MRKKRKTTTYYQPTTKSKKRDKILENSPDNYKYGLFITKGNNNPKIR